jgi:hypothetical protein
MRGLLRGMLRGILGRGDDMVEMRVILGRVDDVGKWTELSCDHE